MSDERSGYKHDSSDKKLDHAAEAAKDSDETTDTQHSKGPGHDAEKISKHDDPGKDRLFEHREQRDFAERMSEKNRVARDVAKHHHTDDDVAKDDTDTSSKR